MRKQIRTKRRLANKKTTAKKGSSTPKIEPLKAINLSPEEREMFRRGDYTGLEYYRCEQVRRGRQNHPLLLKLLAKHDAEQKKIDADPKAAMRQAHEAIDRGTSLLLKLVRAGTLRYEWPPSTNDDECTDNSRRWDEAFDCLASRITYLNQQLVRLAEDNVPRGCFHLWYEAKALAEAFSRLALLHPGEFRHSAEEALTMPSLRARSAKFTADADAIIAAVHLAEKHPSPNIWDNKSRVGALCHLVVVSLLERIHFARREAGWKKDEFDMMKRSPEEAPRFEGSTVQDFIRSKMAPVLAEHVIACANLPDWNEDSASWWKGRVLPLVKEEFASIAETPSRNPALWTELKRGGERDSLNDMRRYMEKICKNKFDQIARTR